MIYVLFTLFGLGLMALAAYCFSLGMIKTGIFVLIMICGMSVKDSVKKKSEKLEEK